MKTPQKELKETLESSGIPFKKIECYGSQIVITSWSEGAAQDWAILISKFAKIRGIIKSRDYAKENKQTCLNPSSMIVWRTFGAV